MRSDLVKMAFAMVLFMVCPFVLSAQIYRQLTLDDFKGVPQRTGATIAYTHCTIDFHYTAKRERNYYQLNCIVSLLMDKDQSWIDIARITSPRHLSEILDHEQGHYIIAYCEQQELRRELAKTRFGDNYKAMAAAIFDRVHDKYEQLTKDYDDDTSHSMNRLQQMSWDKYFHRRLVYMPGS